MMTNHYHNTKELVEKRNQLLQLLCECEQKKDECAWEMTTNAEFLDFCELCKKADDYRNAIKRLEKAIQRE